MRGIRDGGSRGEPDRPAYSAAACTLGTSRAKPLDRDQQLAKFRACWEKGAVPRPQANADRLIETIDRLETIKNTNAVGALMCA